MDWLDSSIAKQKQYIKDILRFPLQEVAFVCARNWGNQNSLDNALKHFLDDKQDHRCRLLYAIDLWSLQHSSNISDEIIDTTIIGQDLSNRPYLTGISDIDPLCQGEDQLILSDVYVDKQTRKPCITALHSVIIQNQLVGFVAADFGINDLPLLNLQAEEELHRLQQWRQIKGDPSIRSTLFQQTRTRSVMDEHLTEVLDVVTSLVTEQGIFHAKLHFSSARATLWSYTDPYRYRLHVLDEIINPEVCLFYARAPYPENAIIQADNVYEILALFKELREADETIYLRAASLNIMNGLIGLNFSCDGSHYLPVNEFLNKDTGFWFGNNSVAGTCNVQM